LAKGFRSFYTPQGINPLQSLPGMRSGQPMLVCFHTPQGINPLQRWERPQSHIKEDKVKFPYPSRHQSLSKCKWKLLGCKRPERVSIPLKASILFKVKSKKTPNRSYWDVSIPLKASIPFKEEAPVFLSFGRLSETVSIPLKASIPFKEVHYQYSPWPSLPFPYPSRH